MWIIQLIVSYGIVKKEFVAERRERAVLRGCVAACSCWSSSSSTVLHTYTHLPLPVDSHTHKKNEERPAMLHTSASERAVNGVAQY